MSEDRFTQDNSHYWRTGGGWHAEGLAMYLQLDGQHGAATRIAERFGVSVSTVARTIKSKRWKARLAEKRRLEAGEMMNGAAPPADIEESLPVQPAPLLQDVHLPAESPDDGVDLRSPGFQKKLHEIERAVGHDLVRRGVEALQRLEVKSVTSAMKLVQQGMALLQEAHGTNKKESSLDVNVQLSAIGKMLHGVVAEETKQIPASDVREIDAVDADWRPTPEPDWNEVKADAPTAAEEREEDHAD